MFGLPIPEGMRIVGQGMNGSGWASVVGGGQEGGNNQEEEEMEMEMEEGKKGEAEGQLLTEEEGERARAGLVGIEESVLDWAARGEALGNWLAEVSFFFFPSPLLSSPFALRQDLLFKKSRVSGTLLELTLGSFGVFAWGIGSGGDFCAGLRFFDSFLFWVCGFGWRDGWIGDLG